MILLDTDVLTHIQIASGDAYERLARRLDSATDDVAVTVVSLEEHLRGWLAQAARATTPDRLVTAYRRLHELHAFYVPRTVVDFEDEAARQFAMLRSAKVRVGTMDLRIAAIALSRNALLVSRNLRDFEKVPGLRVEDWMAG